MSSEMIIPEWIAWTLRVVGFSLGFVGVWNLLLLRERQKRRREGVHYQIERAP